MQGCVLQGFIDILSAFTDRINKYKAVFSAQH